MTLPWPSDIGSGKITWWLGSMSADNWDEDRDPQLSPYAGVIVDFMPDITRPVRYSGTAGPRTIMPESYQGIVNDAGYLCTMNQDGTAGEPGVILPATDSATITPRDWTYSVQVKNNRLSISRFSFQVSDDSETDLTEVVPVDQSGGTAVMTVDNSVGKRIYVGSTLIHGETGTRIMDSTTMESGHLTISREGNTVRLTLDNATFDSSGWIEFRRIPLGFRPGIRRVRDVWLAGDTGPVGGTLGISAAGYLSIYDYEPARSAYFSVTYETSQPWPTSLPGTPL